MPSALTAGLPASDAVLDIRTEVCPMTFVRTRLALDRLLDGQVLHVLLRGEEPLASVPRAARELGHAVLAQVPQDEHGAMLLVLRKGGPTV